MRSQQFALLSILVLVAIGPLGLPEASAQGQSNGRVCLAATTKTDGQARPFSFVVPKGRAEALESRGFVRRPCSGEEARINDFRKAICKLAEEAPRSLLTEMEANYGIGPSELCTLARSASGGEK